MRFQLITATLLLLASWVVAQEKVPDPEIERQAFKVADGFEVTLFAADPLIAGDEDPTRVTVGAASAFRVQKISTYLRDPNVLLAGDTLRYTITVKNISNADALNAVLRDAVPANTTYVAGSTTLNGAKVADVAGVSPLVNDMPINSPTDLTPGSMPADASSNPANVATITFDVVVNANAVGGTVISNQGFVSATGIVDQPSDDPRTPAPNDPTRDIVGNRSSLYAEKRVALFTDLGSPGIVDPGDVLRYTITVKNSAAIAATGVALKDSVPANTTYVANSTLLNGLPVGQPDGGVAPLASGINTSRTATRCSRAESSWQSCRLPRSSVLQRSCWNCRPARTCPQATAWLTTRSRALPCSAHGAWSRRCLPFTMRGPTTGRRSDSEHFNSPMARQARTTGISCTSRTPLRLLRKPRTFP